MVIQALNQEDPFQVLLQVQRVELHLAVAIKDKKHKKKGSHPEKILMNLHAPVFLQSFCRKYCRIPTLKAMIIMAFIFLLAGIIISKDLIIKSMVTVAASKMIGAPVHMDSFFISISRSTIRITGLKMYNPAGFSEDVFLSCPKINIIFDRTSLFHGKPHFLLVDIDLKDMVITKNKERKLNIDSLEIRRLLKPSIPVQIDLINLNIGQIVYKDYTVGPKPSIRVDNINKHKSYKRLPSIEQLLLIVLAEPMRAALIKNAEIYGAVMLTGVAVVPVAVTATFIGKDDVQQNIDVPIEHVYKISREVIKQMGRITKDDGVHNEIKANINGSMVALRLRKRTDGKTEIIISARKYMLPEVDIAGGVLYQILDKL